MMEPIRKHLQGGSGDYDETSAGDLFFQRHDGQGMYVRSFDDGTYDWSVNVARNDTNLMEFREPQKHRLEEVLQRIDDFLAGTVPGRLVLDTLGLVHRSMALGMSREEAERAAIATRDFIFEMHEAGMSADEIKRRFGHIHADLKRQRLEREAALMGESSGGSRPE
jgi:hypothetical protein